VREEERGGTEKWNSEIEKRRIRVATRRQSSSQDVDEVDQRPSVRIGAAQHHVGYGVAVAVAVNVFHASTVAAGKK